MIQTYIDAAMRHAHYEMIQDDEPFYGEIPELQGVWASGYLKSAGRIFWKHWMAGSCVGSREDWKSRRLIKHRSSVHGR
jgi:hypothetical protein